MVWRSTRGEESWGCAGQLGFRSMTALPPHDTEVVRQVTLSSRGCAAENHEQEDRPTTNERYGILIIRGEKPASRTRFTTNLRKSSPTKSPSTNLLLEISTLVLVGEAQEADGSDHRLYAKIKINHKPEKSLDIAEGARSMSYTTVMFQMTLLPDDWRVMDDPTEDYDALVQGLLIRAGQAKLPRVDTSARTSDATNDLLGREA
ncbi:unnamed protein product [Haemonchus placei]|uniref:Velvet domain-containing protein n=1 Tax=Haemonchus placei TaxID=6290 RepID=A0A0N4WF31_HAEPC|nr:unnamed protein product [Haemonchus placei]